MKKEPPYPNDEDYDNDFNLEYSDQDAGRCPDVDVLLVDGQIARFASSLDDCNTPTLLACVS